jgi:malonyl-CoA/methylmalonyl-CoA synthetase
MRRDRLVPGAVQSRAAPDTLWALFSAGRPADGGARLLATPDGIRYSYDDAWRRSSALAAELAARGLARGDRVAVRTEKSPAVVLLYLACVRSGVVFAPLNPAATPHEVALLLEDLDPSLVVTDAVLADLVRPEVLPGASGSSFEDTDCGADETAAILYTSGTTGRPKGAVLSHRNLASNAVALIDAWGFSSDDVLLHALPVFHAHGLFVALNCVLGSGASMEYLPRFEVDGVLDAIGRCSVFMGVPTYYTRLLAQARFGARDCASMRLFVSGSAPLAASVHEEFLLRTGHSILERYGMTETLMLTSNPLSGERRPGTVGLPLAGVEIRVMDAETGEPTGLGLTGEIEVRGPGVFSGYWHEHEHEHEHEPEPEPAGLFRDGFFRTGDLGRFDRDGYLELVGRSRDVVITGGLNVYPKEVELVLDAIDGVAESAVIGMPDPDFGEAVVAFVVPQPGHRPGADDLRQVVRSLLAGYKVPKRIEFVDALPRNAMGKVAKAELRDRAHPSGPRAVG